MKKSLSFIFAFLLVINVFAQEDKKEENKTDQKKIGLPNLPGSFFFEFGWSVLTNNDIDGLENDWWSSRAVNVFYTYDLQLGKSNFSFSPGIGLGFENIAFKNNQTIGIIDGTTKLLDAKSLKFKYFPEGGSEEDLANFGSIKKSKLGLTYIDIPLEFRYSANGIHSKTGFKAALGAKVGYLVSSHTKVVTSSNTIKNKENFNLNDWRYGVYGRVGFGWFNLFYYQNLSKVFKKDKFQNGTNAATATFGISLDLL